MPIYEFECQRCHHVWDRLQRLSDPDPEQCPACGAAEVGRRVTAAAFRLKGAGWYETDFKNDKSQQRNLAGEKESAPDVKPAESAPASGAAETAAPAPAAPAPPVTPAPTSKPE